MKKIFPFLFLITWCHQGIAQGLELGYEEINGIRYYYGDDKDSAYHKLNLVIPDDVKHPSLFIWIGGGAWSYVDRNVEMDIARKFAAEGIAVASVGHRLSPATWRDPKLNTGIQHPEHVRDLSRAIKFLYQNADKYGYSPNSIFVGGFSSGAHLATLVVMDHQYLNEQNLPEGLIKGVIPISGTFDIPHYYKILSEGMGKELADNHVGGVFGLSMHQQLNASPTSYLEGLEIPMLLFSDRNMLRYHQLFEEQLRVKGVTNLQSINLHNFSHAELWHHLSEAETSIYRDIITKFISDHESPGIP